MKRGELRRRIRDARKHGCLREAQRCGGFPVVAFGCSAHPVEARAVVDDVQIHLEDFVLGVGPFNIEGEQELLCLAREGLLIREEEILYELLRDRARTLLNPPVLNVDEGRTRHARQIKAPMIVEASILNGNDGVFEIGRDMADGHIVRTVHACLNSAADEENACDLLIGIRRVYFVQLIRRELSFRSGEEFTKFLPYLGDKEKDTHAYEKKHSCSAQEKTPKSAGRFFLAGAFPCCCFAPSLSLRRSFVYRVVHSVLRMSRCSKYFARIRFRISARLEGSRRML